MKYTKEFPLTGRAILWSPNGWTYLITKDDGEKCDFHSICEKGKEKRTKYNKEVIIKNLNSGQSTFVIYEPEYSIY